MAQLTGVYRGKRGALYPLPGSWAFDPATWLPLRSPVAAFPKPGKQ